MTINVHNRQVDRNWPVANPYLIFLTMCSFTPHQQIKYFFNVFPIINSDIWSVSFSYNSNSLLKFNSHFLCNFPGPDNFAQWLAQWLHILLNSILIFNVIFLQQTIFHSDSHHDCTHYSEWITSYNKQYQTGYQWKKSDHWSGNEKAA